MSAGANEYESLRKAIREFALLDEDESLHIDQELLASGLRFIWLIEGAGIQTPRVFAHGGDALVFTWDRGTYRRYITTDLIRFHLQDFAVGKSVIIFEKSFDVENDSHVKELIRSLSEVG